LEELAIPEKGAIKIGPFGSQLKREELVDDGVHVVGIENVLSRKFDSLGDRYVSPEKFDTLKSVEVKPGDLVITMMGTIGKVAVVPTGTSTSIMDSHLLRFRPNLALCVPEFVAWFLRSPSARAAVEDRAHGAIMKGLNSEIVRSLAIPLPPLSEQHHIVQILDKADHLRHLRGEADSKADRVLPALFIKMFGDPRANPHGWDTGVLGDAIVETQYGTSKRASSDGGGVLVLRMTNISVTGRIDLTDTKHVTLDTEEVERLALRPGDILFNRTNSAELVGKTGLWNDCNQLAVAASYLIRCRFDRAKVIPGYIWALMNTPFMKSTLAGRARRAVGMANINATELRGLPGLFPPLHLQESFVIRLRRLDELAGSRQVSRDSLERLFRLLMKRAFSGDLTASWRGTHLGELLHEMQQQARAFAGPARTE
jgi:type I restriction enzyme S subunit